MKAAVWLISATALLAQSIQQPSVSNAKFETRVFSGDLAAMLDASEPAWFGYAIKTIPGNHESCCFNNEMRRECSLEERTSGSGTVSSRAHGPIQLEGSDTLAVLFRVENNRVEKIRGFSTDCPLDAGGRRFVWVSGVPAETSLRYLETLATTGNSDRLMQGALFAIAQHDAAEADNILERFTEQDRPAKIREQAVFWFGASRGARGLEVLKQLLAKDDNDGVCEKAVFALSISKQPGATDALIDTARRDRSPHVRGQALFWLAQRAGTRAASTIRDAIENDPDTQVKKQAVFAMSQLPKDESVPKLIEIARTQRNAEVRKQAFFWLGQSSDPRALAFFQQVLLH